MISQKSIEKCEKLKSIIHVFPNKGDFQVVLGRIFLDTFRVFSD